MNTPNALEEASTHAVAAAQLKDLEALADALEMRSHALEAGDLPTVGVHAAGELTAHLLRDLIRETTIESARLRQVGDAFGRDAGASIGIDSTG
ncbi:MAG: hypothetical protein ABI811_20540 [Acidobacteriota bacterium]